MKFSKNLRPVFVGTGCTQDGTTKQVLNGKIVFSMVDSMGIPLDIIMICLEKEGFAFDLLGFLQAAKDSKNYTKEKLRTLVVVESCLPEDSIEKFNLLLYRVFD